MGYVVISLDCEGLWGLADRPWNYAAITDDSLRWAYSEILSALDRNDLLATFAFVGAFARSADEMDGEWGELLATEARAAWLAHCATLHRKGDVTGWHAPWAAALVRNGGHEIASHSYTHLPLHGTAVSECDIEFEFRRALEWGNQTGNAIATYVFPRNQVPGRVAIRASGIVAYRAAPVDSHRVARLVTEAKPWRRSGPVRMGIPVAVPGDHFMNWRSGIRRVIPPAVTVHGWRTALAHAARTGGVAHLWFHPHNLTTGFRQIQLMDALFRVAREAIDASGGELQNMTQVEYAAAVLPQS